MSKYNKTLILLLIIFPFVFFHCSKANESAPFFDGLYLKYHEVFGNPQNPEEVFWIRDIEYTFKKLDDGNFHVSQEINTQRGKKMPDKLEPIPYPAAGENLTIDKNGIVIKGGDFINFVEGYPSYLWLPFDKRKKGAKVTEVVRKVEEKIRWQRWQVWSVKGLAGDLNYYDVKTGILVGNQLISRIKMTLTDTNLETLKSSLKKNMKD